MNAKIIAIILLCMIWGCQSGISQPARLNFSELPIEPNFQLQVAHSITTPNGEFRVLDTTNSLEILTLRTVAKARTFIDVSDLDVFLVAGGVRFRAIAISVDIVFHTNDNPANTNFTGKLFEAGSIMEAKLVYILPKHLNTVKDLRVIIVRPLSGNLQEVAAPTDQQPRRGRSMHEYPKI